MENRPGLQEMLRMRYRQLIKPLLPGLVKSAVSDVVCAAARSAYRAKAAGAYRKYLEENKVRKLQLGSGDNILGSWLNTDLGGWNRDAVYLDATKPMPFMDGTFDYVFAEHMIEHLDYRDGEGMLRECFRVMRPGGRIRLATPDLAVILGLYTKERSREQDAYVRCVTDAWLKDAPCPHHVFVINNAMRAWGHRFIHDFDTLSMALKSAGFSKIKQCKMGESSDPHLRGIEKKVEDGYAAARKLETLIVEAEKER
jgi:predicted SAM-dependent methyltransferase